MEAMSVKVTYSWLSKGVGYWIRVALIFTSWFWLIFTSIHQYFQKKSDLLINVGPQLFDSPEYSQIIATIKAQYDWLHINEIKY